jgi:hypothetical protein
MLHSSLAIFHKKMLTADLANSWHRQGKTGPRLVDANDADLQQTAADLVALIRQHEGRARHELETALNDYIGLGTDYRILRGFIKLLLDGCEFAAGAGVEASVLREAVFTAARARHPVIARGGLREEALADAAERLSLMVEDISENLYADLPERQLLEEFEEIPARELPHRYNLAQAQALLYRCGRMELSLTAQSPASRRQIFNAIKRFRLIHRVTGDAAQGYEITLDGPVSIFHRSQKYGIQMAAFLPALLLCEGWRMRAEIDLKDGRRAFYELDSNQKNLQSHYLAGFDYTPETQAKLLTDWAKLNNGWAAQPTAQLLHVGAAVFLPDVVFRHAEGREVFLETLGFWTPKQLQERLAEFERCGFQNYLILASEELCGSRDEAAQWPPQVILYKSAVDAKKLALALSAIA